MSEEIISKASEEIKNASEDKLKETIESWYTQIHTQGLKTGANYISAAIFGVFQKHVGTKQNASLRDYKRMTDDIIKIVSVQLKKQNDEANNEVTEEEAEV